MSLQSWRIYFLFLSIIAVALLWGVSVWNGTVKALFLASWYQNFEDGTPFKTEYTGFLPLDFPIGLLVAFFFYGTNGHDPGYQLFLIDGYATLQSAFVWLYVESNRGCAKPSAVKNPILWGLLWQGFGGAISLPLYYYYHISWLESSSSHLPTSVSVAQAIPISFLLGAVLPTILGMLPTWIERPDHTHQVILAAWQLDPLWVSLVQGVAVFLLKRVLLRSGNTDNDEAKAVWWTRASYLLAALSSALGHLYVLGTICFSDDLRLSYTRLYVPILLSEPNGSDRKLMGGPWLFLQYDLIIIALSSLSWAYLLSVKLVHGKAAADSSILMALILGGIILGPGATVSLVLWWREDRIEMTRTSRSTSKATK